VTDEQVLIGGMDPRWAPVRVGETVRRPAGTGRPGVTALLQHLEAVGFDGAPRHLGWDEQGREVLTWIAGDVPLPPYPDWAMTEQALADLGAVIRRFHEATASFVAPREAGWATDWADPAGRDLEDADGQGEGRFSPGRLVVCHNDLYPENVVFEHGRVVALIDFAMAAPGRPLWDLAIAAELWCPLGDPSRRDQHPSTLDGVVRFGILARAYGLEAERADELLDVIIEERAHSHANIRAEVAAGNESWIRDWATAGGDARAAADDAWIVVNRAALIQAVAG
jgi:hypothetical protein